MKSQRLFGALCAGLLLICSPAHAAEQSTYVTPVTGPMSMATFAGTHLNPALRALASCHNGTSAPANGPGAAPLAYQCWVDTTANPSLYKIYDGASWITLGSINTSTHVWSPYGVLSNATGLPVSTGISGLGTGIAAALAVNTGSAGAPVLLNGGLGLPSSGTATNLTGLPVSTGISGLGANVAAFLATPSSANLRAALTDEVGTGDSYFVGGALGTPASGTATNLTGLPISTGVSGLGTGIAAALAVNTGSAGAPVLLNGGLGLPSSGTATNLTGTASGLTAGNVTTNANLTGDVTSVGNATTLTNAPVIAKVLTGFASTTGTVTAADSILSAIEKVYGNDALKAPLASPAFTGVPTAPTASPSNNSTQVATTAYVDAQVAGGVSGVASLNGQTGALVGWSPPQGRLTLTPGISVTTSDVTGATSHYYTPYSGNIAVVYDGTNVIPKPFSEYSQATSDTTKSPYAMPANAIVDILAWDDGGTTRFTRTDYWSVKGTATVTIATPGVFSFTAHGGVAGSPVRCTTTGALPTGLTAGTVYYLIATGLTANAFQVAATVGGSAINTSGSQSGTHTCFVGSDTNPGTGAGTAERDFTTPLPTNKNAVTNGPAANRGVLVGSIRSNASSQLVDSLAFRWVSNVYNAVPRTMRVTDPATSAAYTTATFRQANANAANQLDLLQSLPGNPTTAKVICTYANTTAGAGVIVAIDLDTLSTTTINADNINSNPIVAGAGAGVEVQAHYNGYTGLGRRTLIWKEWSGATGAGTFYYTVGTLLKSGITGTVLN